jgi:hypothetical protein
MKPKQLIQAKAEVLSVISPWKGSGMGGMGMVWLKYWGTS